MLVGNYLFAALVVVPILRRLVLEVEQSKWIAALVARSRPWVLGSLLAFIVTGTLMLLTDSHYLGFMEIGNAWSVWMYTRHLFVIGVIVLGGYLDMGVSRRFAEEREADRPGLHT